MDRVNRTSAPIPLSDPREPRSRMDAPEPEPREGVRVWGFDPAGLDDDQDFGPLAGGPIERADATPEPGEPDDEGAPALATWTHADGLEAVDDGYRHEPLGHEFRGEAPKASGIDRAIHFPNMPSGEGVKLASGVSRSGAGLRDRLGVDRPDRARRMMLARRAGKGLRAGLEVDGE